MTAHEIEIHKRKEWILAFKRQLNARSSPFTTTVGIHKFLRSSTGSAMIDTARLAFDEQQAAKLITKSSFDFSALTPLLGKCVLNPADFSAPVIIVALDPNPDPTQGITAPRVVCYTGPVTNKILFVYPRKAGKTNKLGEDFLKTFITPFFKNLAYDKKLPVSVHGASSADEKIIITLTPPEQQTRVYLNIQPNHTAYLQVDHPDVIGEPHYHYETGSSRLTIAGFGSMDALYFAPGFDRSKIYDINYLLDFSLNLPEQLQTSAYMGILSRQAALKKHIPSSSSGGIAPSEIPRNAVVTPVESVSSNLSFLNNDPEARALLDEIYDVAASVGIRQTIQYTPDLLLLTFDTRPIFEVLRRLQSPYWAPFAPLFGVPYFFEYKGKPLYTVTHLQLASVAFSSESITTKLGSSIPEGLMPSDKVKGAGLFKGNYMMPYNNLKDLAQYEKYYKGGIDQLKTIIQSDLSMDQKVELLEVTAALTSFS